MRAGSRWRGRRTKLGGKIRRQQVASAALKNGCPSDIASPTLSLKCARLLDFVHAASRCLCDAGNSAAPLSSMPRRKIFRKSVWLFPGMYERCPTCGLKFEREDGYFLGAMYIGYGLGVGAIAVLAALVWAVLKWPLMRSVEAGIVLFLPLAPVLTWMARVLWIYMDQAIDPDRS